MKAILAAAIFTGLAMAQAAPSADNAKTEKKAETTTEVKAGCCGGSSGSSCCGSKDKSAKDAKKAGCCGGDMCARKPMKDDSSKPSAEKK